MSAAPPSAARPTAPTSPCWSAAPWRDLLRPDAVPVSAARILEALDADDTAVPPTPEAAAQQRHYDAVAAAYMRNLDEPQVREYQASLDDALERAIAGSAPAHRLGTLIELCCGHADGLTRFRTRCDRAIGVDVSRRMLDIALARLEDAPHAFIHGDATRLPLRDGVADTVLLLGGIHHVNDRAALYREIARLLRPGGRLVFREPLDDLWLWRSLRWLIYRLSPNLDAQTERPLRRGTTCAALEAAGLSVIEWRPAGLIGFCLFMNTDVLVVNRLFRYVPGIRALVRATARLDAALLRVPGLSNAGLQVIGVAQRPVRVS